MATDKTEPRIGLIFSVGALAVVSLLVVRVALGAYFDRLVQAEELRKVGEAKPDALLQLRADESQRLSSGRMPIESALHELSQRGRMDASAALIPTASRDVAPLQGWARMPGEVPPGMMAPPPPPPGSEADASAEAAAAGEAPKKPVAGGAHKKTP